MARLRALSGLRLTKWSQSQVLVVDVVMQHVPDRDHDGVLEGDDGPLLASPVDQPVVSRRQVGVLRARGGHRGHAQRVLPDLWMPPDSWLPGQTPAQDARCPAVGNRSMSAPVETRVVDGAERRDVLLDGVPSQANRAELALLKGLRGGRFEIPLLEIRHEGAASVVLTSLELPHRFADAYLLQRGMV